MPRTTTARRARLAAGILAGAAALLPLAACNITSDKVSCSGTRCTATLSGNGAKADILGTTVSLSSVKDGTATLGVGGASVSCTQGQSTSAGPLTLECTKVTDNSVELTASLG